jgi:hypothetical protein
MTQWDVLLSRSPGLLIVVTRMADREAWGLGGFAGSRPIPTRLRCNPI